MSVDRVVRSDTTGVQQKSSDAGKPPVEKDDGKFSQAMDRFRDNAPAPRQPADNQSAKAAPMPLGTDKQPLDPRFFAKRPAPVLAKKGQPSKEQPPLLREGAEKQQKVGPGQQQAAKSLKSERKQETDQSVNIATLAAAQLPVQAHASVAPAQRIEAVGRTLPASEVLNEIVKEVRFGQNELGLPEFQFDFQSSVLEGLKLKISTEGDTVRATFIAQSEGIGEIIKENSSDLATALKTKGLNLAELNVSIGGGGAGEQRGDDGRRSFAQTEQGIRQLGRVGGATQAEQPVPDAARRTIHVHRPSSSTNYTA